MKMSLARNDDLLYALDPVLWSKEVLGFNPDPLAGQTTQEQIASNLSQLQPPAGKSTTSAVLALHETLYRHHSLGLAVAPSLRQSGELMMKFDEFRGSIDLLSDLPRTEDEIVYQVQERQPLPGVARQRKDDPRPVSRNSSIGGRGSSGR